jgi:DNA-binding SARP family transcriptional activator
VHFQAFGDLRVVADGTQVHIGSAHKVRLMLAALISRHGESASIDWLTKALWERDPPRSARRNIQLYAYRLRAALGARLVSTMDGYRFAAAPHDTVDVFQFCQLVGQDHHDDVRRLRHALGLWRAEPFAEFVDSQPVAEAADRLRGLRLSAYDRWARAELMAGRFSGVAAEFPGLCEEHPFREDLHSHLMLALSRSGRRADALEVFHSLRLALSQELGLEPGPAIQHLQAAILRGDAHSNSRNYS